MTIETVARAKRIYADSNIFIYFLEGPPEMQAAAHRVFAIAEKTVTPLITSELVLAECLFGAYKSRNEARVERYRALLQQGDAITLAGVDIAVLNVAAMIGPQSRLKLLDAIHVATAIEASCDVFVTNDFRIRDRQELDVVQLAKL